MELKVIKYRNIGIIEDSYVEDDYWDEHRYCGFELNNGKCIVYVNILNHFGDDCNGSESVFRYIDSLSISFEKEQYWKGEEVDKKEIEVIENYYDENDSDFDIDTDIITV